MIPKFRSRPGGGMYNIKVAIPREKLIPMIPFCKMSSFPKLCQEFWVENIAKPWMMTNVKDRLVVNMTETTYVEYMPDNLQNYDEAKEPIFDALHIIYLYIFPFFLFFGTVGSIACLILLNRYSHMVWSTCFYLSLLMGIDLLLLYAHCGNEWYFQVTNVNLSEQILLLSNSICKVYNFLINFLENYSSWITVCISIELMIAIRFPHHMYRMCTRERAQAVMLLIVVLLVCLNLHYFWTYGLTIADQDPQIHQTICHENFNDVPTEFHDVWNYVQLFVTNIFPFIVVTICTVIAISVYCFQKNKKVKEDTQALLSKYFLDLGTLHQMKVATGIMFVMFLPLALLRSCVEIVSMLGSKYNVDLNYDDYLIVETIARTLGYFYISFKPYIFIVFSSKLRSDLVKSVEKLYKCRIFKTKNKQYRVSNTDSQPSSSMDDTFTKQGARPKIFTSTDLGTVTDV